VPVSRSGRPRPLTRPWRPSPCRVSVLSRMACRWSPGCLRAGGSGVVVPAPSPGCVVSALARRDHSLPSKSCLGWSACGSLRGRRSRSCLTGGLASSGLVDDVLVVPFLDRAHHQVGRFVAVAASSSGLWLRRRRRRRGTVSGFFLGGLGGGLARPERPDPRLLRRRNRTGGSLGHRSDRGLSAGVSIAGLSTSWTGAELRGDVGVPVTVTRHRPDRRSPP